MRYRHSLLYTFIIGLCVACTSSLDKEASDTKLAYLVNPLIGTGWVGNTYPGASLPHGMVQLSPDNGLPGWDRIAGYYYPDSTIAGFSHTHLSGTGAGDMYDVSFLPTIAPAQIAPEPLGLYAQFSHEDELASAGYYRVLLQPYNIEVELTATERVGIQRYTFHTASDSAMVTLNLAKAMNWDKTTASYLAVEGDEISGHRHSDGWARDQRLFFFSRLSRQPESVAIDSLPIYEGDKVVGYGYIARLLYRVQKGDTLVITTALSGVDAQGARLNHKAEAPHFDFDSYRHEAERAWERKLSIIQHEYPRAIAKEDRQTTDQVFYSALYHALLCPNLYSDADGRYLGADRGIHQLPQGQRRYHTFSLWDTYRAAHPLYNIIEPEVSRDMISSLLDFGQERGSYLPVWNMWASETDMMIGYHSVPVIVEAILRGVYRPSEAERERITRLFRSTAERRGYRGLDDYRRLGYVPADKHPESLSKTLEYAYDDAAILRWAQYIGDSTLVRDFTPRASSWRNLWDSSSRFMRPRLADGSWRTPFDPYVYSEDITESNAYQYLMSVQHDPEGLLEVMGGADSLAHRLDDLFTLPTPTYIEKPIFATGMWGQYAHGNEPGHHVPFLYNIARRPWQTAERVHEILKVYPPAPEGLCGNEDCGQMSAWYVFASMGFYPLDPVTGQYELVTPLFERSTIDVGKSKPFTIATKGEGRYISRVWIDDKPWTKSYITYEQIMSGADVLLELTTERGVCWY